MHKRLDNKKSRYRWPRKGQNLALPKAVIDIIRQHHGTSLIQYFYYKALNSEEKNGKKVDERLFRYNGPKPQFKESAIVSLADALEAASRSLKKVTSQTVAELVEYIVNGRMNDGQLSECGLTPMEIIKIKETFKFALLHMLHSRVSYPKIQPSKARNKSIYFGVPQYRYGYERAYFLRLLTTTKSIQKILEYWKIYNFIGQYSLQGTH